MIVYDRLWETMKKKGISQYSLIKDYHVNEAQLHRLRKNKVIKTITLKHWLCGLFLSTRTRKVLFNRSCYFAFYHTF